MTEEQKQFVVEGEALKRSIRDNIKARRFSIFVLVFLWAVVVFDAIRVFTMPGELTLKHIAAQNNLQFQLLWAYIYTLWCPYSIPKGDEKCQSAIGSFLKKWERFDSNSGTRSNSSTWSEMKSGFTTVKSKKS